MSLKKFVFLYLGCLTSFLVYSQKSTQNEVNGSLINGLQFRNIAPAKTGGRIADLAIDPKSPSTWFAAVASGHVWKTTNGGITWKPVFENYGSYSTGTITIDPNNSNIVWLGTGENNAQRSVSKGDGVYKSVDGGNSWTHMGLKTSEHIGKIMVDPRNSNTVFVASQGSVWKDGGERGLYKTKDGGETWERVLHVSDQTGISDIIMDPRNPEVLIASAYQRRRHPGAMVAGGPDGGIWKSIDGGDNWKKLSRGLPGGDLGRIGLAVSPQQPDVVYALVIGTDETSGFFRSSNFGENWRKMSDYTVVDAQYYVELFPDPGQFDKVYSVNTRLDVTYDGGRNFERVSARNVHVDHHAMAFDPGNPDHILLGNDGGVYETLDGAENWRFFDNLPITQFYRVGLDNDYPFYNVYGGTQDNASLGGPSSTISGVITNADWYVTTGGDGFQTRVDPKNPNVIYSESQYGGIVRFDKQSGQRISIKPQPGEDEEPYRFHWNAPLLISPHNNERLYFAANMIFKSEDRGNSWSKVSGDLSLNRDRNRMKIMDRVWGIDAVYKNVWTSPMGTVVALDESPLTEGLLIAGTDDGQVSLTRNGGETWSKLSGFDGVPANTFVADVHASPVDANTLFVIFNNHKFGDYKPYIFRSTDLGKTWKSLSSNLPAEEYLWSIYQDHVNPSLLFLGAEYGLYVSVDGGKQWIEMKSGIPTIAIRDLEIQRRENDLVAASFGRGFYILDDYTPLRTVTSDLLAKDLHTFPVRDALQYAESRADDGSGSGVYTAEGRPFGAVLTYYLSSGEQTLNQQRKAEERAKVTNGEPVYYPEWDQMIDERIEESPRLIISIYDSSDKEISRMTAPLRKGIQRTTWNLRNHVGAMVAPGTYTAKYAKVVNGVRTELNATQAITVKDLKNETLAPTDPNEKIQFLQEVYELYLAVNRSNTILRAMTAVIDDAINQVNRSPELDPTLNGTLSEVKKTLYLLDIRMNGDDIKREKMELTVPSVNSRISNARYGVYSSTYGPTATHREDIEIAKRQYSKLAEEYNALLNEKILPIKEAFDASGSDLLFPVEAFTNN